MIKRFSLAALAFILLTLNVYAKLSPAIDIIEKRLEDRKCQSPAGNIAPQAADSSLETYRNISVFSDILAADPDGDEFDIKIVKYPSKGSIRVNSSEQFVYSPKQDFIGRDSFEYVAEDIYGNESQSKKVSITVSKPPVDIYFDDMENHWAHNAAIKMASTGLMAGDSDGTKHYFHPDSDITRGDFLALSLIMAGREQEIPFTSKTVFADDSTIPSNIKSYAQYAYDKGIISGIDNGDGTINFESTGSISRSEAAVITSKILNVKTDEGILPSYKDAKDIPVWANDAVNTLSSLGIMNGNALGEFSGEKNLSRAEGAEIICNVASYIEDKQAKEKEQKEEGKKGLFNLWGLLG